MWITAEDLLIHQDILSLNDTSTTEEISLKREILPVKSGVVTYETAVSFTSAENAEFSLFIGEEDNPILNLFFNKQKVCNVTDGGRTVLTNIKAHVPIYVKAEISMDDEIIKLYIDNTDPNGNDYEGTLGFANNVNEFKNISFHTGDNSAINTILYYVNIYKNFLVNEKFMTDPVGDVPNGFTLSQEGTGSGIADAPGSTYRDDQNGFLLKNTEDIPEIALTKTFANTNSKTSVSWTMLMPEIQDGFYARIANDAETVATIYTGGGKLFADGHLAEEKLVANLWYTVSADIDTVSGTYDLKLNKRTVLNDIPLYGKAGIPTKISFTKQNSGTVGEMLIDDIEIIPTFEKYDDYPTAPVKASSDGVDTAMFMYSMWREGIHYGWDTISPYADERKPLMGYYTEGQREVADWQNKWLIEHGVDYAIYPFVRPSEYKVNEPLVVGEPIKSPVRGEDLMDGYMNSYYKDDIDFAIMLSQFSTDKYKDADDFVEHAVPYIKEYFFKNPHYKKINNKLPVFNYSIGNTSNAIGGYQGIQKIADALNNAAKELGYGGIIYCVDAASSNGHSIVENVNRDYLRIWNYTKVTGNIDKLKEVIDQEYSFSDGYIPSISVGYDDTPWRESTSEMMSAADVKKLCQYVEDHEKFKEEQEKMVVFTCWNEYGEGHFFAPSTKESFGYLNAIRDVFTRSGEKIDEETPSDTSIARMGVFYPNGRGALKVLNDKNTYNNSCVTPIARIDLGQPDKTENCTAKMEENVVMATATGTDPKLMYTSISETVDMSKVKAIKVRAYTQNTDNLTIYYRTGGNVGSYGTPYKFTTSSMAGDGRFTEYILKHDSLGSKATPTGMLTALRIDPSDSIAENGGNFGIDWIEFYEEEIYDETYPITLNIGGVTYETSSPIQEKEKEAYVPVYSILLKDYNTYVVWDEPTKTLTVEKGENKIVTTAGSKTAVVNGKEVEWKNAPYYEKGNIFVPCTDFFEAMGYAVDYVPEFRTINCSTLLEKLLFNISATQVQYKNIAFDFWNGTEGNAYYIHGTSINGSNLERITKTVDGEDAIKIEPSAGAGNEPLFVCRGLSNNGQYMRLADFVAKGTKMKVSFSYRGVGGALEVASREGNGGNTEQAPNATISSTEWKTFEYEFDNSVIPITNEERWVTLRLKTAEGTTPYLYVKDFKISYPEEKKITQYNGAEKINFILEIPTGSVKDVPYTCYLTEYKDNELINFVVAKEGNTKNEGDYVTNYEYAPQTGNKIKMMLWSELEALCKGVNLTKE